MKSLLVYFIGGHTGFFTVFNQLFNQFNPKKSSDLFLYRCNLRIEGIRCNTASSLLPGSFFEKMKISFHDFFYILNCWRMSVDGNITDADLDLHESTISIFGLVW